MMNTRNLRENIDFFHLITRPLSEFPWKIMTTPMKLQILLLWRIFKWVSGVLKKFWVCEWGIFPPVFINHLRQILKEIKQVSGVFSVLIKTQFKLGREFMCVCVFLKKFQMGKWVNEFIHCFEKNEEISK